MIERYSLPTMAKIWELSNKYRCWLDVELAVCRAMYELQIIPAEDHEQIQDKADFDVDRIAEIENQTRHDIIAFVSNVAENIGPASRWVHYGLTSSDVLDTATALQLKQAGEIILGDLIKLREVLKIKAREHKYTLCMGRSHGIHAEPTSFGLKFALWYDETSRNISRMEQALTEISLGKISGAVGNYAYLSPEIEEIACENLGLKPANVTTQVISRDSYSQFLSCLAIVGSTIEKIALEIRHLQRTEVGEAQENFSKGQKGSSAMPHKKNPITSEQLCGLARVLRNNAGAAYENNALWHERDISHSSVERIILPDSTILANYMLDKVTQLLENLVVNPEKMKDNIEINGGVFFSQALLLKLVENGLERDEAYQIVQKLAFKSWQEKVPFETAVNEDDEVNGYLSSSDLESIFSYDRYTDNVDHIFRRLGI
jgi:adenylosuccinate lyase